MKWDKGTGHLSHCGTVNLSPCPRNRPFLVNLDTRPVSSPCDTYSSSVSSKKEAKLMSAGYGYGGGFALIVVLFILLIIVGTSYVGGFGY